MIKNPPVYYEVLEAAGGVRKPPVMLIHGGAHTGACYRTTADGRPGWADVFANAGHRVVVCDWPGCGRSGHVYSQDLTGERVVDGLAHLLSSIGEPMIVMTHSMSGAYGWKLLERCGENILKLVAVAPAPPGNIQPIAAVLSTERDTVQVASPSGIRSLSATAPLVISPDLVRSKFVGASSQFPQDQLDVYTQSLQAIPPRLFWERVNVDGAQLKVSDFRHYFKKPILVVTGTHDADHPRDQDAAIADWLKWNGAEADYCFLGDLGVVGNGHMLMLETNSDVLAGIILRWVDRGVIVAPKAGAR